jgi:hypothetical protein
MRKRALAAVALLVLGACLENPGVDKGLAEKHNRLSASFRAPGADGVRLRIERTADGTELYLANRSDRSIDSLEFFAQVSDKRTVLLSGGIGTGFPVFDDFPVAEFNGKVVGLQAWTEADLGPLTGIFPEKLDESGLIFIALATDTIWNPTVNRHVGYYSGVFTARDSSGADIEGTLRGVVSYSGFHFWMRTGGHERGTLNGTIRGDSVYGIRYGDATDYVREYSATSLGVDLATRPGDSIGFAAVLRSIWDSGNLMDLQVTLSRSEPLRWPATNPKLSLFPASPFTGAEQ